MPRRRRGGGGGGGADRLRNRAEGLANQVIEGAGQWNEQANEIAGGAQDYAQNNPYSQAAQGYIGGLLGGDISSNPFMGTINRVTGRLNPSEQLNWLQQYAGSPNPPGGAPGGSGSGGGHARILGGATPRPAPRPGGSGGGVVPDTVGNLDTFFARQMRDLFDPAHLDPANDPTMQPVIDMIQREAQEDYLGNLNALQSSAQAGGRYGSGLYQAMRGQQIDEQTEGVSQAIAQQLMGAYQAQQGRRMEGLGQVNTRDISAMQDMTNRYGIDAQRDAAMAASANSRYAVDAQLRDAAEGRRLQAMGMNLDAQLGLLGLAGNMGSVLQQGQANALNAGLGYGQLGMSGFDTAINAGGLGLQGLGMIGGIANQMAGHANAMDQMAYQREQARYSNQQDALNDYLNIIMGVGGMGGSGYEYSQGPGAVPNYINPVAAGVGTGIGTGLQIYGGLRGDK